jgi:hypothetical protein
MKQTWTVEAKRIERLRIVGPYAEGKECLEWLYANGFSVTRSGPYTDREMHPACDIERFLFTAEREIERVGDEAKKLHVGIRPGIVDGFHQFARNGVWGTCVDCPGEHDSKRPEDCVYFARYDHQLTLDGLVHQYARDTKARK